MKSKKDLERTGERHNAAFLFFQNLYLAFDAGRVPSYNRKSMEEMSYGKKCNYESEQHHIPDL